MKTRFLILIFLIVTFIPVAGNAEPYGLLIKRGNRYFKRGLYSDALGYYSRGTEKNRKALEPYFNSADAFYKLEDYNKSIEELTKAMQYTKKPGRRADIHYNLGNNYFQLGDYARAVENYKKGLEYNPDDLNMKYNLELALKKMSEQKPAENESAENKQNREEGQKAENGENNQITEKNQSANQAQENTPRIQKDFTPDEARRLVNSTNTDQSKTLAEIIRKKVGSVQNEKDW